MPYISIAPLSSVAPGKPAVAYEHGHDIAVFMIDGSLYATERWCPHKRGDLSDGAVAGCVVTCPDHGWSFDLTSGACHKDGGSPIRSYPLRVVDGHIEVEVEPRT